MLQTTKKRPRLPTNQQHVGAYGPQFSYAQYTDYLRLGLNRGAFARVEHTTRPYRVWAPFDDLTFDFAVFRVIGVLELLPNPRVDQILHR